MYFNIEHLNYNPKTMTDASDKVDADAVEIVAQPSEADRALAPAAQQEIKEKEPELRLEVVRECNNPEGLYVGMSKKQRDALGVQVGGTVELFDGSRSLGIFTIGTGAVELTKEPGKFTANGIEPGKTVTAKKAPEKVLTTMELPLSHGIEKTPTGLSPEDEQKHTERITRRMQIIGERFPGVATDEFITVPTAVVNQMLGSKVKIATISQLKVRLGGEEIEIVMVPAGKDIGLTTKAAAKLGIPPELTKIRFKIVDGVMVID
jgi:hypothetical protein